MNLSYTSRFFGYDINWLAQVVKNVFHQYFTGYGYIRDEAGYPVAQRGKDLPTRFYHRGQCRPKRFLIARKRGNFWSVPGLVLYRSG